MLAIKLPREQKQRIVSELRAYVGRELDREIGELAGESLLDFMLGQLAPSIYNQAIADARQAAQRTLAALEDELYALEKSPAPPNRR